MAEVLCKIINDITIDPIFCVHTQIEIVFLVRIETYRSYQYSARQRSDIGKNLSGLPLHLLKHKGAAAPRSVPVVRVRKEGSPGQKYG